MELSSVECFLIVMAFLLVGEVISEKTKAYVPSVFISAVLFLIGFWTFAPKDIVVRASFGKEFIQIAMGLLLVHLGTLMSLKKLIAQWKAVVVAVCGICGIIALTMSVGLLLFDWHTSYRRNSSGTAYVRGFESTGPYYFGRSSYSYVCNSQLFWLSHYFLVFEKGRKKNCEGF